MNSSLVIALPVLVLLWATLSYNRFVWQRNLIRSSWSNIDTELRRRYDLIPNLVETVKGYAAHERQVLEAVTRARADAVQAQGDAGEQATAEGPLVAALRRLFAVVEGYPDLKASGNFLDLQHALVDTEDRLQAARRFYNLNVQSFNRRIQSVPSSMIAGMFHFEEAEYFEIEAAVRAEVSAPPSADPG